MSMTRPQDNMIVPITGDTVQISNSDSSSVFVVNPAGTLATLTFNFPTLPYPAQQVEIASTKAITNVTFTGGTFNKLITTLGAWDTCAYTYDNQTLTWVLMSRDLTEIISFPTRSISATGFQVSATRSSLVFYTAQIVTTATIGGGSVGYVTLETSPNNSTWTEAGRLTNGQVITLAIALNSIQTITGQLSAFLPIGYYARLRSVNTTGTPTYSYVSGQEILMN